MPQHKQNFKNCRFIFIQIGFAFSLKKEEFVLCYQFLHDITA